MTERLHQQLAAAHAEALRVGDSPQRADQLAAQLPGIRRTLDGSGLPEDTCLRIQDALALAERVLRRDDDGREAARHLQTAIGLLPPRPRKPSPFGDDD